MTGQTTSPISAGDADFMFDRETETMARSALGELQLERLRWSLAHAYERVPHYLSLIHI